MDLMCSSTGFAGEGQALLGGEFLPAVVRLALDEASALSCPCPYRPLNISRQLIAQRETPRDERGPSLGPRRELLATEASTAASRERVQPSPLRSGGKDIGLRCVQATDCLLQLGGMAHT